MNTLLRLLDIGSAWVVRARVELIRQRAQRVRPEGKGKAGEADPVQHVLAYPDIVSPLIDACADDVFAFADAADLDPVGVPGIGFEHDVAQARRAYHVLPERLAEQQTERYAHLKWVVSFHGDGALFDFVSARPAATSNTNRRQDRAAVCPRSLHG